MSKILKKIKKETLFHIGVDEDNIDTNITSLESNNYYDSDDKSIITLSEEGVQSELDLIKDIGTTQSLDNSDDRIKQISIIKL